MLAWAALKVLPSAPVRVLMGFVVRVTYTSSHVAYAPYFCGVDGRRTEGVSGHRQGRRRWALPTSTRWNCTHGAAAQFMLADRSAAHCRMGAGPGPAAASPTL